MQVGQPDPLPDSGGGESDRDVLPGGWGVGEDYKLFIVNNLSMMIHNNNQRQFKYSMKDWLLVLLLFQNCLSEAVNSEVDMKSICSDPQIHRFLDISNANI